MAKVNAAGVSECPVDDTSFTTLVILGVFREGSATVVGLVVGFIGGTLVDFSLAVDDLANLFSSKVSNFWSQRLAKNLSSSLSDPSMNLNNLSLSSTVGSFLIVFSFHKFFQDAS